ncbi:hypothetical protein GGX14DRAFT_591083 [Mycena pura]|uniref:Uncharacterized protein n=1 Tax=Mycena pura TaxID=153505 RepID=A0AAD6YJJ5_9AGAR|nr:hypothetical protein GGX14DRAFT_591083 [Mycena pura]
MIVLSAPKPATSNDASVAKYIHPPPYIPGPYTHAEANAPRTLPFLPSLSWFCLTKLAHVASDQASSIGDIRLNYRPPVSDVAYDLLRALIPSLGQPEFDWAVVDPRLWVTIVQIYDNLPSAFRCYPIPLADEHLPLLQSVPSTPHFSLITILELPACPDLSDTTVVNVKYLHGLCALDASATLLSSYGVKVFSGTVLWSAEHQTRRGPWGLRILRLRNCKDIDDNMLSHLTAFRLLSILDIRGTRCHSKVFSPSFEPAPQSEHPLYHPTPLRLSVKLLRPASGLFSSPNVFTLHINTLYHSATSKPSNVQEARTEDVCVTFTARSSNCIVTSSTDVLKGRGRLLGPEYFRFRERVKGESHSRGLHRHQSRTSIALQESTDRVAEEELSALVAKQDIASFYGAGRNIPQRNSFSGYSYPPEAPLPPSAEDSLLMLYRPPPLWAVLEAAVPDIQPLQPPKSAEVAKISKRKMAEMTEFMDQFNEKRRKIQQDVAEKPAACAPESVSLSRNPFRRKVKHDFASERSSLPLIPTTSLLSGHFRDKEPKAELSASTQTFTKTNSKLKAEESAAYDHDEPTARDQRKFTPFDWKSWSKN